MMRGFMLILVGLTVGAGVALAQGRGYGGQGRREGQRDDRAFCSATTRPAAQGHGGDCDRQRLRERDRDCGGGGKSAGMGRQNRWGGRMGGGFMAGGSRSAGPGGPGRQGGGRGGCERWCRVGPR